MMPNAVELIKADHDKVERLYQQYQSFAGQPPQQRSLAEQICQELEIHATLEEHLFYPTVEARLGTPGAKLVSEALSEHSEMKLLIGQLREKTLSDEQFDRTFHKLMQGVQHHVREEEREMLPRAERQMGEGITGLGMQMQERREEILANIRSTSIPGVGTLAQRKTPADQGTKGTTSIQHAVDVNVPLHTVYNQWTQFEEFPHFMEGVKEVTQLDDTHLHWKASIGGKMKEWDAVITEQIPDQRIAWTNTTGARNAGVVTFHRLADHKTRVMLQLDYEPEGVVENIGDFLGMVNRRVEGDLTRFKQFIEARGSETGAWRGTVEQPHR